MMLITGFSTNNQAKKSVFIEEKPNYIWILCKKKRRKTKKTILYQRLTIEEQAF